MSQNNTSDKKKSILGALPKAAFANLAVGLLALAIGAIWGGPQITISKETARLIFFIFISGYLAITFWSIISLVPKVKSGKLQTGGLYKYLRHPMYGAIIFVLNPALAILLRSWLLILACLPIYFIWKRATRSEEKELVEVFKEDYLKYKKNAGMFFPNLLKINKPAFFASTAVVVFVVVFVGLNFSAFYLRAVNWEKKELSEEPIERPLRQSDIGQSNSSLPVSEDQEVRQKYDKGNSIVIGKINIDAPLVFASGTSQRELNQALNQGVVIYPGSKLPGESGNVFLTGHSSTYPWNKTEYGQVFTLLDRLEPGDSVVIYFNQYKYEYQVTKKEVLTPDNVMIETGSQAKTLSLMTCWPIGTAWKRLLVEAVQIQ